MKKILAISSGGLAFFLFSCGTSNEVHVKKESAPVYVLQKQSSQLWKCSTSPSTNISVKVNAPDEEDRNLTLKVAKNYIAQNNLVTLSNDEKGTTRVVFDISKLKVERLTETDRIKEKATLLAQVSLKTPQGQLCKASKPIEEEVIYQKPIWDNSTLPAEKEIKKMALKLAMDEVLSSLLPKKVLTVRPVKLDSANSKVVGSLIMHKKYDKAINIGVKKINSSKKADASLLYNIGVAYEAKAWTFGNKSQIVENLQNAKTYYEKALEVNKKDKEINAALKAVRTDLEILSQ